MRSGARSISSVAVVACVIAFGSLRASGLWNASTTIPGTTVRTDRVLSQAQPTCTNVGGVIGLLGSAQLTWSHVDTRYEYAWRLVQVSNGNVAATGVAAPTGPVGSTVTLPITASLIALGVPGVSFDVVVTARLRGTPAWTAPAPTFTRVRTVSLVLIGLSMRCG